MGKGMETWLLVLSIGCWMAAGGVTAQCPWSRNVPGLHGSCACSYNLAQELTLQCGQVNFTTLMDALNEHAQSQTIDLFYVHNSTVMELRDNFLSLLTVHNVQMSRCHIRNIQPRAFLGQETTLKNLNLQDNLLTAVPTEALRPLKALALLDLSGNRISHLSDDAFASLKLNTLKLADNGNMTLSAHSFRGLERTLKNLNLKGTRQREVPAEAVRPLSALAFLDLAQNGIRSLGGGLFRTLDSLTALNMERNSLSTIEPDAFLGVNDTLSSLSLLNNLITEFPSQGLAPLTQLRVLDVGFNLMNVLPDDAFSPSSLLTLLALDGNPLATLPRQAFAHLNGTLRGLSLGGRFLECDCRLRWVAEWIRDTDLQVTSRERSPQFCGSPPDFRSRSFYQLGPDELTCPEDVTKQDIFTPMVPPSTTIVATVGVRSTSTDRTTTNRVVDEADQEDEDKVLASPPPPPTQAPPRRQQVQPQSSLSRPTTEGGPPARFTSPSPSHRSSHTRPATSSTNSNKLVRGGVGASRTRPYGPGGRPNLITGNSNNYAGDVHAPGNHLDGIASSVASEREVIVKDAYRQDTSVVIQWDSETSNILGFRVVYRLFGDTSFQPGPPLDPSEREFKIKNVPAQESLVVCVVSLEESNVTPETVPFPQCREIRTEPQAASHMDKIIIAASAAICGTVVVAVVIFICCNRKRSLKSEKLRLNNVLAAGANGAHHNGISTTATSLAGSQVQSPLASMGSMGMGQLGGNGKDWDQLSMYSSRSIPRARMYHSDRPGSVMGSVNGGFIADDARSHVSGYSVNKSGNGGVNLLRSRSLIDGPTQRSVSALSGRGPSYLPPGLHHGMGGAMGHHLSGLHGMGLGPLGMAGMGGSMNAMAGLPTLSGMGLSRADLRASHHSLADLRMSELAAAAAVNGRASRASRASTRAGSQYSSRRSEQLRRRAAHLQQQQDSSDQQHQQQQTTGDESSWETDREPGGSSSTSGLLAGRRPHQPMPAMNSQQQRHNSHRMRPGSSVRSGETENWTDHDMDIYMAHNTMRNDLVRL
ncbi:uncharacterized protein LOC130693341 isoform X1 [Daphnia carinata]|uniref:uncharacterized protein LOC130693341 isoform X1 n=1 Tax=Daphnia carinata TaxID=120202 RepID=UPI00257D61C1|nr:uncharacterized protein LOC130693341 isoform X1 [Daphnia carinata]